MRRLVVVPLMADEDLVKGCQAGSDPHVFTGVG